MTVSAGSNSQQRPSGRVSANTVHYTEAGTGAAPWEVVAAGAFTLIRGAAACRTTAGGIIGIGPIMDIVRTGGITMAAATIHIGAIDIGTATDRSIRNKSR